MCHKLPLKKQFDLPGDTLTPADLLLTKLQIIELNAKDRGHAYAILTGFPIGDDRINIEWIAELTARDWGLQHTLELNLGRLRAGLSESPLTDQERATVTDAIDRIESAMDEAPSHEPGSSATGSAQERNGTTNRKRSTEPLPRCRDCSQP